MYVKDPADVVDYKVNWLADKDPVLSAGETIATATWTVPPGITKDSDTKTTTTTTVWLSGGVVGERYDIACRITTNQQRTFERTFTVQVENL